MLGLPKASSSERCKPSVPEGVFSAKVYTQSSSEEMQTKIQCQSNGRRKSAISIEAETWGQIESWACWVHSSVSIGGMVFVSTLEATRDGTGESTGKMKLDS